MNHQMIWRTVIMLGLLLAACGEQAVTTSDEPIAAEQPESTDLSSAQAPTSENNAVEEEAFEETVPPLPPTTEPPEGVVAEVRCEENAMCAEEFILNGRIYSVSCAVVLERSILFDDLVGSGTAFAQDIEVFAIEGNPDHGVVAISRESGCSENPADPTGAWSFAFATRSGIQSAVCEHGNLSDEQRIADGCNELRTTTTTATTAPPEEGTDTPLTFEDLEVSADGLLLTLSVDACEFTVSNRDVVENDDQVVVTLSQPAPPPPTTNELGEEDDSPDCQGVATVRLQEPLAQREVIDGNTGLVANA